MKYNHQIKTTRMDIRNYLNRKNVFKRSDFDFYVRSSAVFSASIEGNSIELNEYLKNKRYNVHSKKREMGEIDDLVAAYNFAMENKLTKTNLLKAHALLTKSTLDDSRDRGHIRRGDMGVVSETAVLYTAPDWETATKKFTELFQDINELIGRDLSIREVFYYASMIHLWFEQIHPFQDGNGRSGRLLEKWFLATKLGKNTWSIQSEKYYQKNRSEYMSNVDIGHTFNTLHWDRCLLFLLMLPKAINYEDK